MIAIALFSPIGHIADELVLAHMGEHLLIGDIATLLIVLGLTRSLLQPILAIPLFNRLQVLTHPAVAFPLWAAQPLLLAPSGDLPGCLWRGPAARARTRLLPLLQVALCGCLCSGRCRNPTGSAPAGRSATWIAVRFTGAILGNVLMWSGTVLYPVYAPGEHYWGISPIADQSTAGVIMMVEGTFLALGVLAWTFFEVAREGTEKQRLLDLAAGIVATRWRRRGRAASGRRGARRPSGEEVDGHRS